MPGPKNNFLDPGKYYEDIANYLDKHRVYDTFDFLAKELLAVKPADPIPFLIAKLKNAKRATEVYRVLILGPNPKDCELYSRKVSTELGIHRIRGDRLVFLPLKRGDELVLNLKREF